MRHENITTLTTSSLAVSSSEGNEGKRNRKTQILSALLSASALGVFLEGCGGGETAGGGTPPSSPPPTAAVAPLGSESNPYLATSRPDTFTGDPGTGTDWVSYAGSNEEVAVDINSDTPSTAPVGWARGDTLTDINNLIGSIYDDNLYGNDEANTLRGGKGNDRLAGEAENDQLEGGPGNDFLNGGTDNDNLYGDDIYVLNKDDTGDDTYLFNAGDGTDTITDDGGTIVFDQGDAGNAYAGATYAFAHHDASGKTILTVTKDNSPINVIEFTTYPSSNYAFFTRVYNPLSDPSNQNYDPLVERYTFSEVTLPSLDAVKGSNQNPFLATNDVDSFAGSGGNDWMSYIGSNAGVDINLATSAASSGFAEGDTFTGINNLRGSNHGDILTGNAAANTLHGGAGDDVLEGGAGTDTLYGGAGDDWASYSNAAENKGVRVDLTLTTAQLDFDETNGFTANDNEAKGDILSNIANIVGSNYNDWLTGNDVANRLLGGTGDDRLEGGAGADTYVFNAGDGTDTIIDDGGTIVFLQGDAGNAYNGATYDFVRGDGDAVTLTVTASDATTTLNVLEFTSDPSSIFNFVTRGSDGTDAAIASLAVPPKLGSEENPFMATEDTANPDTFAGSAGADWASYAGSTDGVNIDLGTLATIGTVTNAATVSGGWAEGDVLTGINNLIGSGSADTLTGNAAANILRGGAGDDNLAGGEGADTYLFSTGDGTDTITDDGAGNKLIFRALDGEADYADGDFVFARGNVDDTTGAFSEVVEGSGLDNDDLRITVKTNDNVVLIKDYFDQTDNNAYTIYRNSEDAGNEVLGGLDETST